MEGKYLTLWHTAVWYQVKANDALILIWIIIIFSLKHCTKIPSKQDAGPALIKRWFNVSCLLDYILRSMNSTSVVYWQAILWRTIMESLSPRLTMTMTVMAVVIVLPCSREVGGIIDVTEVTWTVFTWTETTLDAVRLRAWNGEIGATRTLAITIPTCQVSWKSDQTASKALPITAE